MAEQLYFMPHLLIHDLEVLGSPEKGVLAQRFFKTGKGEYGESDIFIGVMVPDVRKIADKYKKLSLADLQV